MDSGDGLSSDTVVAERLLAYLRAAVALPALVYAETPARLRGGFETAIYRFRLADPPAALAGPLVLRLLRPSGDPTQIRLEAAVHNRLAAQGYPVPPVHAAEADPAFLGGAFLVMSFAEGRPLAQGMDAMVSGAGAGRVLRLLAALPRTLERMAVTWADAQLQLHALPVAPVVRTIEAAGLPVCAYTFGGRLEALGRRIDRLGLRGAGAAFAWLQKNRPAEPAVPSVCHGDLHPLNILVAAGRISGVIDWGNATIGDAALDVGSTIAAITTTPFDVPGPMRPVVRGLIRYALSRYRRAYERRCPIDASATRYYQVFCSLGHLVGAADHDGAGRDGDGDAPRGGHALPGAQRLLIAHIRELSGIRVSMDR